MKKAKIDQLIHIMYKNTCDGSAPVEIIIRIGSFGVVSDIILFKFNEGDESDLISAKKDCDQEYRNNIASHNSQHVTLDRYII